MVWASGGSEADPVSGGGAGGFFLAAALVGSSCAHDNSPVSLADPRNRRRRRSTVHPSSNVRVSGGVSLPCASGGSWGHWFVRHFNRLQQLRFSSARARPHPQLGRNDVFGCWTYPASLQNVRAMPGNLPGERQNTDFNLHKLLQTAFSQLLTDYKPPILVYCIPAVCSRAGCVLPGGLRGRCLARRPDCNGVRVVYGVALT